MKTFILLLLSTIIWSACTSTPSQEEKHTKKVPTATAPTPVAIRPKALAPSKIENEQLKEATLAFKEQYELEYDHVAYGMYLDSAYYFVVVNGDWSPPMLGDAPVENMKGSYQMGLVNTQNEVLIPIKFDKIYNMGGTADNLFEVEVQGKRGLYNHQGQAILEVVYDAIYPATMADHTWAYWRTGKQFGVLYGDGSIETLEQQPKDLVQNWEFHIGKKPIFPFVNLKELLEDNFDPISIGIFVYPAYLYDLQITPEYETRWIYDHTSMGLNHSTADVKTLHKATNTTLLTTFKETFVESRDYQNIQQTIVTLNQEYQPVDSALIPSIQQYPVCEDSPTEVQARNNDTIEVVQVKHTSEQPYEYQTTRRYYHLQADGQIQLLNTSSQYPAAQYTLLTEASFKGCFARKLTKEEIKARPEDDYADFEVSNHLSVEDLQYMRNEIYARHGYKFKSAKWQERFAEESWYKATQDNVDALLSPLEKQNVQFLLRYEKTLKEQENQIRSVKYEAGNYAG
ncbi:MAG: YARHG domain-containing protein [Aureispira sp.]